MIERLQKVLARHSLGSRREIESWMVAGRVLLNGRRAALGDRFNSGDRVVLDGKDVTARLHVEVASQVVMYHKPQGQSWSTPGEAGEQSVLARLPSIRGTRWLAINRLQKDDSGLQLVTSDGRLADALMRRVHSIPSVYMVRVRTPTRMEELPPLPLQIRFENEMVEFTKVEAEGGEGANRWFRVEVPHSDKRTAVRALFEAHGLEVSRAIQLGYAHLMLPRDLPRGRHRALSALELEELYKRADLKPMTETTDAHHRGRRRSNAAPKKVRSRAYGKK